jgi:Nickel/cobalt transporter regulator
MNGRWIVGHGAPGGWGGYRRPSVGYILPSYWTNPGYNIGNYWSYGLSRPSNGYGWSRYYDDAVLTDRSGRVYDAARVDWDRTDRYDDAAYYGNEDYSDSYGYRDNGYANDGRGYDTRRRNSNGGVVGAVIGGAIGALTGGLIAGRGDHLAGALIGGGVGTLGGLAIGSAANRNKYSRNDRRYRVPVAAPRGQMGYDYGYGNAGRDEVTANGQWNGTWTGQWNGGPTQSWQGTYDGDQAQGQWDGNAGAAYPAPSYPAQSYPARPYPQQQQRVIYEDAQDNGGNGNVVVHRGTAPGNYSYNGGYYGGEVTTVTIQPAPVTTTTRTVTEEIYYASAPRKRYAPRKVWRPRPQPRCQCRVVWR